MQKRKLIIDTDCGSDDAVAIAMAMREPSVEVLMFSAVCGNVPVQQAVTNTLTTLEYADTYFPPVYKGCQTPLIRKAAFAFDVHGNDGLGDIGYAPKKLKPAEGSGIEKMLGILRESDPGEVDIMTLGPLTNLAVAYLLDPDALRRARRITSMGSAGLGSGNTTPLAEFNIWHDAHAAGIVLRSGLPLMFVGWDACLGEAEFSEHNLAKMEALGELGSFAVRCNCKLAEFNRIRFGRASLDLADPAAMAAYLWPGCIKTCDDYHCRVDSMPGPGYGAFIIDKTREFGGTLNAAVCSQLHADIFKERVFETLK